jgi:hypothetical protein
MAVETRVVATVVGGVIIVLRRRRLAARALPSVAETWRSRAVELVDMSLTYL